MRIRRKYHHHDTNTRPEIGIWIEQAPIPIVDSSDWSQIGSGHSVPGESLVFTDAPDLSESKRGIPGIVENHLYEFTITVDSIDEGSIEFVLGGTLAGSVSTIGTHTLQVRPPGSNGGAGHSVTLMRIRVDNPGSTTSAEISLVYVKALDPITFGLIPILWTP